MPSNLQSATPCAYPPVGSCGNKTSDPTGFCYQHRQMMERAKKGYTEISHSTLRSAPKMLSEDNEVPGTPDDALPKFVRHHGDPDSMMAELQRYLSEKEMEQVELGQSGARIPDEYHHRVSKESRGEISEEDSGDTAEEHREPVAEPEQSEEPPSRASERIRPTDATREAAKKLFPKRQHREIDSMLDQWDHTMSKDQELAERWNSLSEDSQMRIIEARLPSQSEVERMTPERAKRSNSRYLRESVHRHRTMTATLARIDSSSRAAWMAPYDISDSIVGTSARFLRRLFRY